MSRRIALLAVVTTALLTGGCASTRSTVETRASYKPCSGEPEIELVVKFEKND